MANDNGTKWVSAQFPSKQDVAHGSIEVKTRDPDVPMARVKVSIGLTVSLGNYEFARVDAGVELPCYVEEVGNAYAEATRIAESELQRATRDLPLRLVRDKGAK